MSLDPWVFVAIVAMTVVTYATRAGGYLLFRAIKPGAGVRALLGYIPGTLFVAYVAPALVAGGPPQWSGAAASVAIMLATKQPALAILGGTAVAWAVWGWL